MTNQRYHQLFLGDKKNIGIIKRAGLERWPNLFNNLRKSCVIDLKDEHPSHRVDDWIGHTSGVSKDFYLHTRDSDYLAVAGGVSRLLSSKENSPQNGSQELTIDNVEVSNG